MYTDKQLVCQACGSEFAFTADEQEFFDSKGFQDPKKCKPCRDAAKQRSGGGARGGGGYGGGRSGGGGGGYGRPQRQLYDAVCAGCGIATQVPFQPNGSKPVYCRDCFRATAPSYY
jgi:CxxC-x17-CxxC domain-containing protein